MDWDKQQKVRKVLALLCVSVGGEVLCGGTSGWLADGFGVFGLVMGGFVGGVVGLVFSPIVLIALGRKRVSVVAGVLIPASMIVAGFSIVTPVAALLSIMTFLVMIAVGVMVLPDEVAEPITGVCWHCGYEVGPSAVCPECGRDPLAPRVPPWS